MRATHTVQGNFTHLEGNFGCTQARLSILQHRGASSLTNSPGKAYRA